MGTGQLRRAAAAIVVTGALLALASAKPAEAVSFTIYTDYNSWKTAVEAYWTVLTEDFESAPATDNAGFFQDGSVSGNGMVVNIGDQGQPTPDNVWYDYSTSGGTSQQTIWSFDNPIRAWGAYWELAGDAVGGPGTGLNLLIGYDGHTQGIGTITPTIPNTTTNWQFFGFIADRDFTDVLVAADGQNANEAGRETYYMDNMVYAPEPGILTLLGMGLAGAALWMRRRRG
jgi:hypothetical protein